MFSGLRRVEQRQESTVAFALHVGFGNEAERGTVDAIAQTAGGLRAVVEDVTEVRTAEFAAHLRALHAVAVVGEVVEQVRIDGLREGRPAAASVAAFCVTAYCSSLSRRRNSSSVAFL